MESKQELDILEREIRKYIVFFCVCDNSSDTKTLNIRKSEKLKKKRERKKY